MMNHEIRLPASEFGAMPVLILDPEWAERVRNDLYTADPERRDEVWEGVLVVPPMANNEHQRLARLIAKAIDMATNSANEENIFDGCNISDREQEWTHNYRCPDVAVFLPGNPAKDCDTHWVGGPDFLVEVISPGDHSSEKLPFYASVGVREVLFVSRNPWRLEMYKREGDRFVEIGRSTEAGGMPLQSSVLPVSFNLVPSDERPDIVIIGADGRTWTA